MVNTLLALFDFGIFLLRTVHIVCRTLNRLSSYPTGTDLCHNRRTLHYAAGFPVDDDRMIQRATLAGPQPTGRHYSAEADPSAESASA